jgi:uncharacterized protein YggT (Ycf19 family)
MARFASTCGVFLTMDIAVRAIYSVTTLYMMIVLLRWLGAWLSLEVEAGRLRWFALAADPLVKRMRQILPPMGPVDFAPLASLVTLWLIREVSIGFLLSANA